MIPYWILFGLCAIGGVVGRPNLDDDRSLRPMMWLMGIGIALMIGLRFEVGADWFNYQRMFERAQTLSFEQAIRYDDPGYQFLNWLAGENDWGIWFVNLVCGGLFSWGLIRFCQVQPYRWIALTVAVPYVVIVVAMGYTRQGAALGIILAGLASYFRRESILRLAAYVAFAATFHSTAVVAFVLVSMTSRRNKLVNFLAAMAVFILFYNLFLSSSVERFYGVYLKTGYSSQGALIRVVMDAAAAMVFFLASKRLQFGEVEHKIWRNFAIVSIIALVALAISPSSTAVDRLAIYLLPLQIAVFARMPVMFQGNEASRLLPIALFAMVQFVWFNFAAHSQLWVPYQLTEFD